MIVRCPHCGTGHAVRYQPGRSPGTRRCEACGQAFAFFPALEIEAVGLPRDGARMEPVPILQVPISRSAAAPESPARYRNAVSDHPATAHARRIWRHTRHWALRVGGLAIGVALIGTLMLQFLIHERAALADHPELAAVSDALCRQLPCPELRRPIPGTIQIGGLELDAQVQGRLRVELRVTNALDRPQPWPVLELSLSDRFGRTFAQERWTPREYLGPDAAAGLLEPGEVRRLRLVIDRPAATVEGVSVRVL